MLQKRFPLLLGALFVSMVTAAPLANQEHAVAVDQGDNSKDRAKRADEQIVFGNQQNKGSFVSKKSDPDNLPLIPQQQADLPTQGELDKGSEVTVHEAMPVEKDLAERAGAATKDFQDQDKIADAMEAAMEEVNKGEEEPEASDEDSAGTETAQTEDGDGADAAAADDDVDGDGDDAVAEVDDSPAVTEDGMIQGAGEADDEADESDNEEDEDIKDLLQVTSSGEDEEEGQQTSQQTTTYEAAGQSATAPENGDEANAANIDGVGMQPDPGQSDRRRDELFWRQFYHDLAGYPGYVTSTYDLYRRRRSLVRGKQSGARRIKRDLLDGVEYDPVLGRYVYGGAYDGIDTATSGQYNEPSSVLDMGDALISDPDDYVPLTDADAEDLYDELEEYLRWELQRRESAERLREVLGLEPREDVGADAEDLDDFYRDAAAAATGAADPDDARALLESEGQLYPLDAAQFSSSDNPPYYYTAKRGADRRGTYGEEPSKRYFFPFADEPETHWGAFVPEKRDMLEPPDERDAYLDDAFLDDYRRASKRDYNEAIHRLQRLAMALSDNRGSYISEDEPFKK